MQPSNQSWQSSRVSATADLREIVSRFDANVNLTGEEFSSALWEAPTYICVISCSLVSISELWFLLSSRNVPDLPTALGDSEYFRICAWYRSRLEANPENISAPANSELDLHGQDLTTPLSASPSTCQAAADESSSVPSDRQIDSVDVRQSPEIFYITRDSIDDAHAPGRSLAELSRSLV
jgi:hypothetical protein